MIKPKYDGGFQSREDVAAEFQEGTGSRYGATPNFTPGKDFPPDGRILHAVYNTEPYEGSAFVLFKGKGGKLYEVNGGHCSCYGLEGQWKPEETSWDALAIRTPSRYGCPEVVIEEAKRRVKRGRK